MFGASALYHRGNWSPPVARRLLQLDHTAIFLLDRGHVHPDRVAGDGRPRAGDHPDRRSGWSRRPASCSSGCRSRPRGATSRRVYMFLGWIGAFAFVPLYETTGWSGIVPGRGRWPRYTIGAIVHAAQATRSLARDLRLPRDLPRLRDPGCTAALLRDRLPRAPARVSDARVRRRSDHERRNRDFWDADADDYQAEHADALDVDAATWGVWRIPESRLGVLGDARGLDVLELGCGAAQWSIAPRRRRRASRRARPVAGQLRHARVAVARERRVPCPSSARAARRSPAPTARSTSCSATTARCRSASPTGRSPRWPACSGPVGASCSRTRRHGRTSRGASKQERVTRRLRRSYFGDAPLRRRRRRGHRSTSSCRTATGSAASGGTASWSTTWSSCAHRSTRARRYDDFDAALGTAVAGRADLGDPRRPEPSVSTGVPRPAAPAGRRGSASPTASTHSLPLLNAVCCSPSTTSRRPAVELLARPVACAQRRRRVAGGADHEDRRRPGGGQATRGRHRAAPATPSTGGCCSR